MDVSAIRRLAKRIEQVVGLGHGERRRAAKIVLLLAASGGMVALWAFLRRQRDRRSPWSALYIFGIGDALQSLALASASPHFRNSVLASAGLALVARFVGPRIIWLPRWLRKGSYSAAFFFFVVIMVLYYFTHVVEKPRINFNRRSEFLTTIMERLGTPQFRPVIYAFNTHMYTVLCNSLNKLDEMFAPFAKVRRETIDSWDGNHVCLDWAASTEAEALPVEAPVVLLFHGILGSSEDNYARNVMDLCLSRGWRPVVQDRWRIDYGEWRDVHLAVKHIHRRYPRAPVTAVAFSAGAHVLLTYLQMVGRDTPLVGAAVVSPALDLVKMISHMESSANPSYRYAMEYCILGCVKRHIANDRRLREADVGDLLASFQSKRHGCHQMYDTFLSRLETYTGKPGSLESEAAFMAREGISLPADGLEFQSQMQPVPATAAMGKQAVASSGVGSDEHSGQAGSKARGGIATASPALSASSGSESPVPKVSFDGRGDFVRPTDDDVASTRPLSANKYSPFGNGTASHYRRTAGNNLHRVQIPCFVLVSKDDQLIPPSFHRMLYRASQRKGSSIVYASTERGGHCAWHEGLYPAGASFAERLVVQFFAALLAQQSHTHYILTVVRRMYRRQLAPRRAPGRRAGDDAGIGGGASTDEADTSQGPFSELGHDELGPGRAQRRKVGGYSSGDATSSASEAEHVLSFGRRALAHGAGSADRKLRRLPSEGAGTSVDLALADAHARRVRSRAILRRGESLERRGGGSAVELRAVGMQAVAAEGSSEADWMAVGSSGGGAPSGSVSRLDGGQSSQARHQEVSREDSSFSPEFGLSVDAIATPLPQGDAPPTATGTDEQGQGFGGGPAGGGEEAAEGASSPRAGRPVAQSFSDADAVMQSPSKFARVISAPDLQEWQEEN